VSDADLDHVTRALRITRDDIVDSKWCDNGPGWVGVLLKDAPAVLDLRPDPTAFEGWDIGVVGPWTDGDAANPGDADVEVRAFDSTIEDPVTGSLNASLGQWLAGNRLPEQYVAAQGTAIGRRGRVHVRREGSTVWVGGQTVTTLRGDATV
jgi:PhzF family phenazine biosynthesis protein